VSLRSSLPRQVVPTDDDDAANDEANDEDLACRVHQSSLWLDELSIRPNTVERCAVSVPSAKPPKRDGTFARRKRRSHRFTTVQDEGADSSTDRGFGGAAAFSSAANGCSSRTRSFFT
jgi:hypothetical protein